MKSLKNLLPNNLLHLIGEADVNINDVVFDSRKASPSSLFVALPGSKADGSAFIKDAVSKGSVCVAAETSYDESFGVKAFLQVADARRALSDIASKFYEFPSSKQKIAAVTGTKGKTTVTYLLQSILQQTQIEAFRIGTVNYDMVYDIFPALNTTPESLVLQQMLKKALEHGVEYGAMEVSSHALKTCRVEDLEFEAAAFTNLSLEHTEFHPDMEDYYQAKKRLFFELGRKNKKCVICTDTAYGERLAKECSEAKMDVWTVHPDDPSKGLIYASDIVMDISGSSFAINLPQGKITCKIPQPGVYNISNALVAASLALALSEDTYNSIKPGLEKQSLIPGRFERIENSRGVNAVVDFAHTPLSLENVIKSAKELTKGKVTAVFGCGGDRSKEKRPLMGAAAALHADRVVVTSDNPRSENPESIIDQIFEGIPSEKKEVFRESDRKKAIEMALSMAESGDTVIIAGKGHEENQIIGSKVVHFSDRETIEEYFKKTYDRN